MDFKHFPKELKCDCCFSNILLKTVQSTAVAVRSLSCVKYKISSKKPARGVDVVLRLIVGGHTLQNEQKIAAVWIGHQNHRKCVFYLEIMDVRHFSALMSLLVIRQAKLTYQASTSRTLRKVIMLN